MIDLFQYNWQVREDWFKWCEEVDEVELSKERVGGRGSFLRNLYHVVDCELTWIQLLKGEPVPEEAIDSITTLDEVKKFSDETKIVTEDFIRSLAEDDYEKILEITNNKGKIFTFTYGKVLQHIVTHEVHHIGQLSVWSREIGIKPVSSDLINRDF